MTGPRHNRAPRCDECPPLPASPGLAKAGGGDIGRKKKLLAKRRAMPYDDSLERGRPMAAVPLLRFTPDRPAVGVAAGAGFFVLAALLRWRFVGMSQDVSPMTFLPAILLSGLFGGIRIGLAVAALSTLVAWVMFFPPYGTFILTREHTNSVIIFAVTAALELYVIYVLKSVINDLSTARERSQTLFRELQHRVANNFQFVAALLRLRKRTLEPDSAGAQALEAAEARLDTMARVHRQLHDPASLEQSLKKYLETLCTNLIKASDTPNVRLTVQAPQITLSVNTLMSVSLIVAELVTNSLKHAFRDRENGAISLEIESGKHTCTLMFTDDGPGLPSDFGASRAERLGQRILQSLAKQIGGRLTFETGIGTVAKLSFDI